VQPTRPLATILSIGLFFALISCTPQEVAGPTDEAAAVCLVSATFNDEHARVAFVRSNAASLRVAVASRSTYAMTSADDARRIDFLAPGTCHPETIRNLFQLDDVTTQLSGGQSLSLDAANRRLQRSNEMVKDETYRWQCIVRRQPSAFVLTRNDVAYVALRTPQVEWANDVLFVASDDDCETLNTVLEEILGESDDRPDAELSSCVNSSLVQCGYPANIHIQPNP
jgi:hypothetical protein